MESALTIDTGPLRVGIDVASLRQVRDSWERHGQRYLDRIFTATEVQESSVDGIPDPTRLAACFAAKEATLKVLRPIAENPAWSSIEMRRRPDASPYVVMHDEAARMAESIGLRDLAISISHEGDVVIAMVIAFVTPPSAHPDAISVAALA